MFLFVKYINRQQLPTCCSDILCVCVCVCVCVTPFLPVGLDSEKSIVSKKMRKEHKKRGKEAKKMGKRRKLDVVRVHRG